MLIKLPNGKTKQKPYLHNSHNNTFTDPTRVWCSKTTLLKTQIKQWKTFLVTKLISSTTHRDSIQKPQSLERHINTMVYVRNRGREQTQHLLLLMTSISTLVMLLAADLFPFTVLTPCWVRWAFQQRRPACQWGKRPWRRRAGYGPEPSRQISTPPQPVRGMRNRTGKETMFASDFKRAIISWWFWFHWTFD